MDALGGNFNPRSPHGERPKSYSLFFSFRIFISIHAPRTGSDAKTQRQARMQRQISIHAPRTGSDVVVNAFKTSRFSISIHAPRTGSDIIVVKARRLYVISIHAPRTGSDVTPHIAG